MAVGLGINKGRQLKPGHGEGKLLAELPPLPSLELRSLRALVREGWPPAPCLPTLPHLLEQYLAPVVPLPTSPLPRHLLPHHELNQGLGGKEGGQEGS